MESKTDSPVKKVSEAVNRQLSVGWMERWGTLRLRAEQDDRSTNNTQHQKYDHLTLHDAF